MLEPSPASPTEQSTWMSWHERMRKATSHRPSSPPRKIHSTSEGESGAHACVVECK